MSKKVAEVISDGAFSSMVLRELLKATLEWREMGLALSAVLSTLLRALCEVQSAVMKTGKGKDVAAGGRGRRRTMCINSASYH